MAFVKSVLIVIFISLVVSQDVTSYYGNIQKGSGTWHVQTSIDSGACSIMGPPPDGVTPVAIDSSRWQASAPCGMCAQVFADSQPQPGTNVGTDQVIPPTTPSPFIVYVVDECGGCDRGYGGGFDVYTDSSKGGAWILNWTAINCPFTDKISYQFQCNSPNYYYLKLQIRNAIIPVASVSITFPDGSTGNPARTNDNFFELNGVPNTIGPYQLTITAINGEVLKDTISSQVCSTVLSSSGIQFAGITGTVGTSSTGSTTTGSTTASNTNTVGSTETTTGGVGSSTSQAQDGDSVQASSASHLQSFLTFAL